MTTDNFFKNEISKDELNNRINEALALLAVGVEYEDIVSHRKIANALSDCKELLKTL